VAHLVAGTDTITVIGADGVSRQGVVVGIDRDMDLALLAVDGLGATPLPMRTLPAGATGTFVVDRDGPIGIGFTADRYVNIEIDSIDGDRKVTRRGYQVNAAIVAGDSGSVLVSGGAAMGVLYARSRRDDRRAWAVDISELQPLLDADTGRAVDVGECVGTA
jgi:S1-C subfamily serine protease